MLTAVGAALALPARYSVRVPNISSGRFNNDRGPENRPSAHGSKDWSEIRPRWVHCLPMKDVGLCTRVQRDLSARFIVACRAQENPAAQIIRECKRHYVVSHDAVPVQTAVEIDTTPLH